MPKKVKSDLLHDSIPKQKFGSKRPRKTSSRPGNFFKRDVLLILTITTWDESFV